MGLGRDVGVQNRVRRVPVSRDRREFVSTPRKKVCPTVRDLAVDVGGKLTFSLYNYLLEVLYICNFFFSL